MKIEENGRYLSLNGSKINITRPLPQDEVIFYYKAELCNLLGIDITVDDQIIEGEKLFNGLISGNAGGVWHQKTGKCLNYNSGGNLHTGREQKLQQYDIVSERNPKE
ncbi:MAG: hypothetical protein PHU61_01440 [Candidatus Absconditabacteria bacterium]|nr:hypothetical protein [Candidatus Absconditabacteria bacterium]MDD3868037.1 hypothetical protein [Candidatus Absconditabacteria bacterium]MDD4714284.1 hypothetical protein [Candidatus Absconditabacteria bacterium]